MAVAIGKTPSLELSIDAPVKHAQQWYNFGLHDFLVYSSQKSLIAYPRNRFSATDVYQLLMAIALSG